MPVQISQATPKINEAVEAVKCLARHTSDISSNDRASCVKVSGDILHGLKNVRRVLVEGKMRAWISDEGTAGLDT